MLLTVAPQDLPRALDLAPPDVRVLSLDCFDTLIWRNVHTPRDVFAELTACNAHQRVRAEQAARARAAAAGREEVSIEEIYRALMPTGSPEAVAAALAEELAAEARHCFAFRPTVELIAEAKRRGLKVVIVSDTYLGREQLRALIGAAAGADVLAMIDEVFASSEYGVPKAGGLFRPVLKALNVPAGRILHLGDNLKADRTAPLKLGINAVHLQQFDETTEQRLRLEAAAGALLTGRPAGSAPVLQPHRAQLMLSGGEAGDPAASLGHGVLGPILHAYAGWLHAEADALAARTSGRVHLLFLMRDGLLPKLAYEALGESPHPVHAVEISRFTAIAASLATPEAVARYLEPRQADADPEPLGRQLHLTPAEVRELAGAGPSEQRRARFAREVRRERTLRKITARSQAFADRLVGYLRRLVDPAPGDTVVLADLGYNGTVQSHAEPLLRSALGVEVAGRYLLLAQDDVSGCDKRGLLDERRYDPAALRALCQYVSVLEQLCTAAQGSVIDYDAGGAPVRTVNEIKGRQSAVRDRVQAACLRYVREHGSGFHTRPASADADCARIGAAATLARLLFLPLPEELEALRSFEHDVNLGVSETLGLFDSAAAAEGLKRWGVFYTNAAKRMYLSAELRDGGLPLSLTLLTQTRFGLDLRQKDFSHRTVRLPIMVAGGQDVALDEVEAHPTHEGWFAARIPIGPCRYAIGVQFGQLYEWVQLDSARFLAVEDLPTSAGAAIPVSSPASPLFEGVTDMGGGLLRCDTEAGFMLAPPPVRVDDRPMVLSVVFRPLVKRGRAVADAPRLAEAAE